MQVLAKGLGGNTFVNMEVLYTTSMHSHTAYVSTAANFLAFQVFASHTTCCVRKACHATPVAKRLVYMRTIFCVCMRPDPCCNERRPLTLAGVLKLKAEYPDARLVVGNTEVGIEMKFKDARYPVLIGVTHVPELNHMQVSY